MFKMGIHTFTFFLTFAFLCSYQKLKNEVETLLILLPCSECNLVATWLTTSINAAMDFDPWDPEDLMEGPKDHWIYTFKEMYGNRTVNNGCTQSVLHFLPVTILLWRILLEITTLEFKTFS